MKLSDIEATLPAMYYASLEEGGPAFYITSSPGVGKTSVAKKFPVIMRKIDSTGSYGVSVINGANFTLMTAMGFMVPREDQKTHLMDSVFTLPYWYRTTEGKLLSEYTGGLIIVDEADKLGMDEKKIVGEAALSKRLGNHDFPPGWVVIFLGNRMSDKSGSTRDLMHLVNRRIEVPVDNDVAGWVAWAEGEQLLPETIQFAEDNPQLLFEPMPEDQRPWCTPRSLHQADILLRSFMSIYGTDKIPTDPITLGFIKGGIGAPATAQYVKTIRLGQDIHSYEEVVASPLTITLPSKPDAMRLMCYKMASRVDMKDAKAVMQFMARMPEEHQVIFVRMAVQRNYELAFQADFATWCGKKTTLLAVLNKYKVADK